MMSWWCRDGQAGPPSQLRFLLARRSHYIYPSMGSLCTSFSQKRRKLLYKKPLSFRDSRQQSANGTILCSLLTFSTLQRVLSHVNQSLRFSLYSIPPSSVLYFFPISNFPEQESLSPHIVLLKLHKKLLLPTIVVFWVFIIRTAN